MARGYVLHTLGCKANSYDGQLIEQELQKRGWQPVSATEADVCIVNSCTVTDEADRQSRKLAARMKRQNPNARVVVTGCGAEVDPERMAASAGIDYVIGNQDKPNFVDLMLAAVARGEARPLVGDGIVLGGTESYEELRSRHPEDRIWPIADESLFTPATELAGTGARTRAFMKIQDGCNAFCTYCIIPYGRGPTRSLEASAVITQVQELVARGIREVVLTGINLGDYGLDWSEQAQLPGLLTRMFSETRIERVRLSSLDPLEIEPEIFRLVETEPRLCPHFHVSLQSPHARILKLMKRKYSSSDVEACLKRIAALKPAGGGQVFVGMDLITGFPGESEADFDWTVLALSTLPWSRLHVFPYSERAGTPATRLPGVVPPQERARRAKRLRALSFERLKQVYQAARLGSEGRIHNVLLESKVRGPAPGNWVSGYSPHYHRVLMATEAGWTGENQLTDVRIESIHEDPASGDVAFLGRPVDS